MVVKTTLGDIILTLGTYEFPLDNPTRGNFTPSNCI